MTWSEQMLVQINSALAAPLTIQSDHALGDIYLRGTRSVSLSRSFWRP
jgi:hypothetical protein